MPARLKRSCVRPIAFLFGVHSLAGFACNFGPNTQNKKGDGVVSSDELNFGVRSVNKSMISNKETSYVRAVLEVTQEELIDFQCFAVVCALSEKIVALDRFVLHKINKLDTEAMQLKINGCKDMYYMLDERQDGFVEFEMLMREVRAGQISQEHEDIIMTKFTEEGRPYVARVWTECCTRGCHWFPRLLT
jgi:Ca2+-binding EF-hand superfamily protein